MFVDIYRFVEYDTDPSGLALLTIEESDPIRGRKRLCQKEQINLIGQRYVFGC